MQTVSAELATACIADGQTVCLAVEVSWDDSGSILSARGASGWTDESNYLIRMSGDLGINPPGERLVMAGSVGKATVVLDNTTRRFSWKRSDAALYADIGGAAGLSGKPIRLYAGYVTANGAEYVRIFTGLIVEWMEGPDFTVELSCRDWGERYLQDKKSTTTARDKRPEEWIETIGNLAGIADEAMDLDIGIYQIPWCWSDDEGVTEEIWDVAMAEAGLAWFNQNGILIFRNSISWVSLVSAWTFSADRYGTPEPNINTDAVATKIRVDWSGRLAGPDTTLYTLDTYKVILPGKTISWTARFSHASLLINTPDYRKPYNDYYAISGGGLNLSSYLTVTLSNIYSQQCTISIRNNSAHTARLATFKLRGQGLLGGPTEQSEVNVSPAPYSYERVRSERGNAYCQTPEQGLALANTLARRGSQVRPIYILRDVPGIPQLELADLVTLEDPWSLGTGASITALIVGISWEAGVDAGFVQQYSLFDLSNWVAYTNYFVIGTSKLGGPFVEEDPETDYGRLFY